MEGKKRYVAIVLFLLIGLTLFTFANPVEEEKGSKGNGSNKPEVSDKDTTDGTLGSVENQQQTPTQVLNQVAEDNSYEDALAAVERAEASLEELDVEEARDLIEQVTNQNQKDELTERVDIVEEAIEAIKLVEELEKMVEDAEAREDILSSVDYRTDKEIIEKVEALRNEEVQESLQDRLQILSRILDDNTAPKYEGVKDGETTKEDVSITYSDTDEETGTENEVTVKVTLNGEEIEFQDKFTEEGEYVVTLTDEAFNEETFTFTIDKTAPGRVYSTVRVNKTEYKEDGTIYYYVKNGESFVFAMSFTEELAEAPVVKIAGREIAMILNEKVLANENKVLYEGTFAIPANEKELKQGVLEIKVSNVKDAAGNEATSEIVLDQTRTSNGRTVIYDCKNPVIAGVNNNGLYNKPVTITQVDYIVHNVSPIASATIDGEPYELGTPYAKEGKHLFVAYDRAGNRVRVNFTIDTTPAGRVYSTVRVNKKEYEENKVKYYYVKNGDSFEFAMQFTEELKEAPVVKIAGREIEMKLNETVYEKENKVLYEGTFKISETEKELKQGLLEIKVSNIIDLAGNETTDPLVLDQTKTSNGRSVIYDCKNPVIAGVNNNGLYNKPVTITQVDYIVHNVSPIANATIDGKPYELGTEYKKEGTHEFVAYDRAGNRVRVKFTIDMTAPTAESTTYTPETFTQGNVTVTITLSEQVKSVDGWTLSENGKTLTKEFADNETGSIEVSDLAGNKTKVDYNVANIDREKPVATPSYTEKTIKEDSTEEFTDFPTFTVTDNSNSKVSQELISGEVNPNKVGTYKLVYRFTDEAGNYTDITVTVKVTDQTPPTLSGITEGTYYNTIETHAIPTATDKNGVTLYVKTTIADKELVTPWKNGKEIVQVGTYKVYAEDKYGNKSEEVTVHIDPYAPKVLVLDRLENVSGAYLPIKPVILEHNLNTISVTLDGTPIEYKKGDELTKDGKYVMTVTDKAGNSSTVEFTMDSVAPSMMVSPLTLGTVDQLNLNDVNNVFGLVLSEDAEFILLKNTKNVDVLDKNVPIYEYTKLPEDGIIDEEGEYILVAYDKAYNITSAKFTVDRSAPTINAVDGKFYSSLKLDVQDKNLSTITVKKNGALIATKVENGYVIDEDGTYEITAKDIIGINPLDPNYKNHITTVTIHIDTKSPTANVVKDGVYEKVTVKVEDPNLDTASITINGTKYDNKEITEEGKYVLVAKDLAGNTLTVNFEIDATPITISGVAEGKIYNDNKEVKVTARDENAIVKLNGTEIAKEYTVTTEGSNTIKVTDKWGNEEEVTFIIDKTPSTINNPFASEVNEIGARKESAQNVEALVTDNIDANKNIKPVVTHSVKGDMGELSEIPTTKDYIGRYTLTYNTKDTAGNIAKELVVYVDVIVNDYVITIVDVDNNDFTYTYGDTISDFNVTIYSDVLEQNITFEESDIKYEVVGGKTLKDAGNYTVKATADSTKFPNAKAGEQVFTILAKEVEVSFAKTNGTTTVDEYEYDGNTNPFTAEITGLLESDKESVKANVTYTTSTFDVGEYVATASLNSKNYTIKAGTATHTFKIKQAQAKVTLPTKTTGTVKVVNGENQDISNFVNIARTQSTATGTQEIGRFNWKTKWQVDIKYEIINVTAKNSANVFVANANTGLTGMDDFQNITNFISSMKITIVEDLQKQVIADIPSNGTSKAYITDIDYKQL